MILLKLLLLGIAWHTQTSIYTISIPAIDSSTIDFSAFQGKKILIVNTAENSDSVAQYGELEQLYQLYKDSLVIIACPTGNFTQEVYTNNEINTFIAGNYNAHYLIAAQLYVNGTGISPLYQWLTDITQNGAMYGHVDNDFQKYLVDSNGNIIGVFDKTVSPLSQDIQNAITQN